jgi:GIY-YIG catalytic domain
MATDSIASPCPIAYSIYALLDPRTENVYYVGQTTNMTSRLYAHLSSGRKTNSRRRVPVNKVTHDILEAGLTPQIVKLDEITTPHKELALRLEECYRIRMLKENELLSNAWKTGVCVDTDNPMTEAEYVKGYALATDDQIAELKSLDVERAMEKAFGTWGL